MGSLAAPTNTDPRPVPQEFGEGINPHLLELESVLARIDSGRTYYQILGIDRADSHEDIIASYLRLLDVLYPPPAIARALSPDTISRIGRAFAKASQALGVLASSTRRTEYDSALLSTARKPTAQPTPRNQDGSATRKSTPQNSAACAETGSSQTGSSLGSEQAFSESYSNSIDNRRRCGRMKLSIPVRVTGHDQTKGKWHEMTDTIDVSRTGARLRLHHRAKPGTVIFLTLPLPTKMRAHGLAEQGYNVYALIKAVDPPTNGVREVGVEFLGEHPPAGFIEKPWAIYRTKRKGANERRRHRREERKEVVVIEYIDETGQSIGMEEAQTENIGRRGFRVVGTSAPPEFDLITITCPKLQFDASATLRDRYRGKDGLERLCLQLIDQVWPS